MKEHKKLTKAQLFEIIRKHNDKVGVRTQFGDKNCLKCVMVFDNRSWPNAFYPIEERSYAFRSDNKCFVPGMCGYSCFASDLAGTDNGVRLENLWNEWIVEYCYIENEEDI